MKPAARFVVAFAAAAALACGAKENAPSHAATTATATATPHAATKEPSGPDDKDERTNLLNLAHGATVVARSGEASLEQSAIHAVDGDLTSLWTLSPKDYPATLVVALAAPARIDTIGIANGKTVRTAPKTVTFEASTDGKTFTPIQTIHPLAKGGVQLFPVTPVDAAFLRVAIVEADVEPRMYSLFARGTATPVVKQPTIAGCWQLSGGMRATFAERGARVWGDVETSGGTLHLEGSRADNAYRFAWTRNAEHGYLVASVSPDGAHLNAVRWHEEPIPLFSAGVWFGDRLACDAKPPDANVVTQLFLRKLGTAPLYGLRFDANGTIDEAASVATLAPIAQFLAANPSLKIRLTAHEFQRDGAAANKAFAEAELASLRQVLARHGVDVNRVAFAAAGSDAPREIPVTDAMRALYSTIELQISR